MVSRILSKKECSECRVCCCFDSSDLWESPVISEALMKKILSEINPKQKFMEHNGNVHLVMQKDPYEDLYYCPLLDKKKGCMAGDDKPFDCKVWPFRVMMFEGKKVITVSPVCKTVMTKCLNNIMDCANDIACKLFENANNYPDSVKPYIQGYPILIIEK